MMKNEKKKCLKEIHIRSWNTLFLFYKIWRGQVLARFHKICRWCVMFLLSHFFNETITFCSRHGQCVLFKKKKSLWTHFQLHL